MDEQVRGGSLLRRILTYAPGSVAPAVITLLTSMIFTRVFDAAQYGVYSLVLVVVMTVKTGVTTWLIQSIAKYLPPALDDRGRLVVKRAVVLATTAMWLVEAVVALALLLIAETIIGEEELPLLLPAVLYVLVSSVFDVVAVTFPAEHRAGDFVVFQLSLSVLTFVLRLLMVSSVLAMGIDLMFWSGVVAAGALLPVMWWKAGLPGPFRLLEHARHDEARSMSLGFLKFGAPMTLWLVATAFMDVSDRFVIDYFLGSADVGIYDANYRLVTGFVGLMIVPVTMTLHPYLMSVSGSAAKAHIGVVIAAIVENLTVLAALAVGLALLFNDQLALLLGPTFRSGSIIMPIVLAGVFAFNIGLFAHKPFEIAGRTKVMVAVAVACAIVNLALNVVLVPLIGYVGAAYATLAAYVLYCVWVGAAGRRLNPWTLDLGSTARQVLPIAGVVLVVYGLQLLVAPESAVVSLVVSLAVSTVLGLAVLRRVQLAIARLPKLGPVGSRT